jgi:hypothetical protein
MVDSHFGPGMGIEMGHGRTCSRAKAMAQAPPKAFDAMNLVCGSVIPTNTVFRGVKSIYVLIGKDPAMSLRF